ncbi:MAG: hypothetical protein ABEH90_06580 [Halolamina sp.]
MAVAAAGAGFAIVWSRGYLVPGTPRLTRRLPASAHDRIGKGDVAVSSPADALIHAGVLTDDLALSESAATEITAQAREFHDDADGLKRAVGTMFADVTEISVRRGLDGSENWFALDADETTVHQWDARPVVALDAAGASYLADTLPGWEAGSVSQRRDLLALVRYGAPSCPACDEPFVTPDGPSVACCGGRSLVGERRCESCGYSLVDSNDLPAGENDGHRSSAATEVPA